MKPDIGHVGDALARRISEEGKIMRLGAAEISRLIDVSAVKADDGEQEVRAMVATARRHCCAAVFALPSWTPLVLELLAGGTGVACGGAVGFPSGGQTARTKAAETSELRTMGCREIDMVINIGKLVSDRRDEVRNDIRAVVEEASGLPVKVILECHYLSDNQIRTGCDCAIEAGAAWVKTGTGLAPTGATLENVALITRHVGGAIGVKAAGGVRGLETFLEMYRRGARRFGLSWKGAVKVLEAVEGLPSKAVEI
jgi:deoxyribose-phosphate aldolase